MYRICGAASKGVAPFFNKKKTTLLGWSDYIAYHLSQPLSFVNQAFALENSVNDAI